MVIVPNYHTVVCTSSILSHLAMGYRNQQGIQPGWTQRAIPPGANRWFPDTESDVKHIYGSAGHDLFLLLLLFPLCLDVDQGLHKIYYFDHYAFLIGDDRAYVLLRTRCLIQGGLICC